MLSVSIVIPAYNAEKYICSCIESCLSQTFTDYEVIIIDDGSKDATAKIAQKYVKTNSKVVLVSKENAGSVLARIDGLRYAKGEFVFFMDADDVIEPNALELLYSKSQGYDMIIGNILIEFEDGSRNRFQFKNKMNYGNESVAMQCNFLSKSVLPSLCGRLIKREFLLDAIAPSEITIGDDVITNFLLLERHNIRACLVDDYLYHYIQHTGSQINSYNLETILKRARYAKWVEAFFSPKIDNIEIRNCLKLFVIDEYYAFLRDGGNPNNDTDFANLAFHKYWDKEFVQQLPLWKFMMLFSFRYLPLIAPCYRKLFLTIRKYKKKVTNKMV